MPSMTDRSKTLRGICVGACLALLGTGAASARDVELNILMEDVPETRIIEQLLPRFEERTGIDVRIQKLVYSEMHDKLVPQLISANGFYDVLTVDFLWAGEFSSAGWLADLQPHVDRTGFDLDPFIPSMMKLVGYQNDTLRMIPMYNYTMGLIYRTDLLEDEKLQQAYQKQYDEQLGVPETLPEYVRTSRFMAEHGDVAGAAMQGQRGDPNSMEFSNYLFSAGGSYLSDGEVTLDSDAGRQALELYIENIQNAAQQGALAATLDNTFRHMCQGQSWSMVTYWWMYPQLNDPEACPEVSGNVGITTMPGGHGESGGWGWAIPANKDDATANAAWKFIAWVQSGEIATERALMGHAPVRRDVFENEKVLKKYPYYKQVKDIVASGKSFPIFTYTAQYENDLGRQLSLAASGEKDAAPALKAAAESLSQLLEKE